MTPFEQQALDLLRRISSTLDDIRREIRTR